MPRSDLTFPPVGVFDSGVGGLSVLKAIRDRLPTVPLVYVADSGNAPYGDRDAGFIQDRALAIVDFLVGHGAKAIVVACNTATAVAVKRLRSAHALPIVALEPAIKPAVKLTRSGVVTVLATTRTLESPNVARLCGLYGDGARIILQPCPGLAEQVERGAFESPRTLDLLDRYIAPSLAQGADTFVLGCTHYPFLRPQIRALVGDASLLDSSAAVANQLGRQLECAAGMESWIAAPSGSELFFTSGKVPEAQNLMATLWGAQVVVRQMAGGPHGES